MQKKAAATATATATATAATTHLQTSCYNHKDWVEIGVDEAGRGPLFGRVYAAAVVLPEFEEGEGEGGCDSIDPMRAEIKDSKKFTSEKKIRKVAQMIKERAIYAVCWRDEKRIDEINILQATQEAMHEAIEKVMEKVGRDKADIRLLIDGNYFKRMEGIHHQCFEKGDGRFMSIAAASILAKVERDEYIYELCREFPEWVERYDLKNNKGYGTKRHREGIERWGATEWHRKSFRGGGGDQNT
jgi:ribonuclease HII